MTKIGPAEIISVFIIIIIGEVCDLISELGYSANADRISPIQSIWSNSIQAYKAFTLYSSIWLEWRRQGFSCFLYLCNELNMYLAVAEE